MNGKSVILFIIITIILALILSFWLLKEMV
ncbi:hypothetical protein HNQ35_002266 [Cerasibacillus quisquiliarum]|nr:hypothetical protein [Cerasibacillus quisquiliarum]